MFPKQKLLRQLSADDSGVEHTTRYLGDPLNPTEKRLFAAVTNDDDAAFDKLLQTKDEIDWNKRNAEGHTVLQVAVFHGRKWMIPQLIKAGCEPEPALKVASELEDHNIILSIVQCLEQKEDDIYESTEDIQADSIANFHVKDNVLNQSDESPDLDSIYCSLPVATPIRPMVRLSGKPSVGKPTSSADTSVDDNGTLPGRRSYATTNIDMAIENEEISGENAVKDFKPRKKCRGGAFVLPFFTRSKAAKLKDSKRVQSCLRDPKPLILAAAAEDFASTRKLLKGGCLIPEPHLPYCKCQKCMKERRKQVDSLEQANSRLQVYKALTSSTYLILKERDPVLIAIQRSETVRQLAYLYPENKTEFDEMAENTSQLAVDLLAACRNASEVEEILVQDIGLNNSTNKFKYGRLLLAVGLKHKTFVTHPSCQHVLSKLWFGELMLIWMYWPLWRKMIHILIHMCLTPLVCIPYLIMPKDHFRSTLAIPFNRFIYSATSYLVFLAFLLLCTIYSEDNANDKTLSRWYDWFIAFCVVSLLYKTLHDMYVERFVCYWTSWWTMYEFVMVTVFIGSCGCFLAGRSYLINQSSPVTSMRLILVGSGLYSVAITLAFIRTLQWFHLSRNFGHLIVSFSRMTEILLKLLVVFSIVLFAFSIGIHSIYKDFHPLPDDPTNTTEERTSFMNYGTTIKTLFWALFGQGEADQAAVPTSYVWHLNKNRSLDIPVTAEDSNFSVVVGYVLWSLFHVAFVIILLNMLIAVMTNSFETIQENCDTEWKFARTKLWMYYFEDFNAIPPPFNLLAVITSIFKRCCCCLVKCRRMCHSKNDEEMDAKIAMETLTVLIQRYIHEKKLKMHRNASVKVR